MTKEQNRQAVSGWDEEQPKLSSTPATKVMRYMIRVRPYLTVDVIPPKRTMQVETFDGVPLAGVIEDLFKRVPEGCIGRLIFEVVEKN